MKKLSASLGLPRLGLLLLLWLSALAARSQNACPTPPPANCPEPFRVVDASTGQEVRTLTVGCPVRFVQSACRPATSLDLLYYQVVKGTNAIPVDCLPTTQPGVTTYVPTAADVGPVTVFELSNPDPSSGAGGLGVAYIRNYQVVSPSPPGFTVMACANNTALITLLNSGFDQYTVQVNGGAPQPLTNQPVAIVPGVANTIGVTGNFAGSSCSPITTNLTLTLPVAQLPVLARLTRTGAGATGGPAQFELAQIPAGFTYTLQAQTTGQPYQNVPGIPTNLGAPVVGFELSQVPAGRYRLVRTDACGNTATSAEIPTLGLSGTADNSRNTLTFDLYGGASAASYSLARNDGVVVPLAGAATTYVDTNVQCGTVYTYRLTATLPGGGQTVSNPLPLTAQSNTPPPTPLLLASFDLRNRVVITATPGAGTATFGAGGQVVVSRQAGGAAPVAYAPLRTGSAGAASRSLRDSTALGTLLAAPPCYTATLRDTCGNVSAATPSVCPVLLTVEAADPEGQSARLRWTAFQGPGSPAAGTTYQVATLAPDGTVLTISAPLTGLTYLDSAPPLDRQILRYRVLASGAGLPTGAISYSNVGTLTRRPRLVMPTAFTPNGDGLNDVLELKGRYLQNFTFIVVDRNGQEVFRTTDRAKTWDGSINGHAPVNAAYVWRFDLLGEDGQSLRQTGTITILK